MSLLNRWWNPKHFFLSRPLLIRSFSSLSSFVGSVPHPFVLCTLRFLTCIHWQNLHQLSLQFCHAFKRNFLRIHVLFRVRLDSSAPATGDEIECSICLDTLKANDLVFQLPCKHVFHKDCASIWIYERRAVCPNCRKGIYDDEEIVEETDVDYM